jgi:hypothetical protein
MEEKWKFDVFADSRGAMAVLPFGEVKMEIKRQPHGMTKIMEMAAKRAYETNYYNITGMELNKLIPFHHNNVHAKKFKEFFLKDPVIRSFLNGMDKS